MRLDKIYRLRRSAMSTATTPGGRQANLSAETSAGRKSGSPARWQGLDRAFDDDFHLDVDPNDFRRRHERLDPPQHEFGKGRLSNF